MGVVPTPEQIQYMTERIDESLVAPLRISNWIFVALTLLSLVLRVISRQIKGQKLGSDDYSIFAGFVFYLAFIISLEFDTRVGLGRHVILLKDVKGFVIVNTIGMAVYIAGMFCVKCSILMLYNRIFRVLALQKTLIALGVMVLIWALTAFFCSVFLCYPIAFNWDPTIKGRCIDYGKVTLVIGIFNIFLDFALLTVPMPSVWKLNMSTRRKFLVSLIFAAGCCACVVSIARLFYARRVASTYDPTWDNVTASVLSQLEISTGIVACCTITYRPLIEKIFGRGKTRSDLAKNGTGVSSIKRNGWNKINVQHDVELLTSETVAKNGANFAIHERSID